MYFEENNEQRKQKIQKLILKLKEYKNNENKNYYNNISQDVDNILNQNEEQSQYNDDIPYQPIQTQSIYSDYEDNIYYQRYNQNKHNSTYTIKNQYYILKDSYNKMLKYQQQGFKFIFSQFIKQQNQKGGCMLADEAGLGKTIQSICTVQTILSDKDQKRIAVIACPTSIINQWVQEFRIWSSITRVLVVSLQAAQYMNLKSVSDLILYLQDNKQITTQSVLIMSHAILQQHSIQIQRLMRSYKPVIILDEFHLYKNPKTLKYTCIKSIQDGFIVGLTGTPIQNNYLEIYYLFSLLQPKVLGSKEQFTQQYEKPIKQGSMIKARLPEINFAINQAVCLMKLLATIMLRRYKQDVINNLPKKVEKLVWCRVNDQVKLQYMKTKAFRDTYNDVLDYYIKLSKSLIRNKNTAVIEDTKASFIVDKLSQLYNLNINKQNIFYLVKTYQTKNNILKNQIHTYNNEEQEEQEEDEIIQNQNQMDISQPKCIIFCHNLYYIEIYTQILQQIKQLQFRVLTGSTSTRQRQTIINDFNYNTKVQILLSTAKVGGIGLNLTAANHIFLIQPHFNPAIDEQSIQRSYRIGQKREVNIYRLMYKDTIEEKTYRAAQMKVVLQKKALQNAFESVKIHINENFETGRCIWPESWDESGIQIENIKQTIQVVDNVQLNHTNITEASRELLMQNNQNLAKYLE